MSKAVLEKLKTRFGIYVTETHSEHGDDTAISATHDRLAQCVRPIGFQHHRLLHSIVRIN